MFIDCSYEGDLMAKADVSYTVGTRRQQHVQRNMEWRTIARQTSVS